jgi:hypothetical protein
MKQPPSFTIRYCKNYPVEAVKGKRTTIIIEQHIR